MNREIKFRAWDKINNKVRDVEHIDFTDMSAYCRNRENGNVGHLSKDFCNLMQYTGFKDKNGVEIYEGDILVASDVDDRGDGHCDDALVKVLVGERGCFVAQRLDCLDWYFLDDFDYKIIGNIYENGDLLSD